MNKFLLNEVINQYRGGVDMDLYRDISKTNQQVCALVHGAALQDQEMCCLLFGIDPEVRDIFSHLNSSQLNFLSQFTIPIFRLIESNNKIFWRQILSALNRGTAEEQRAAVWTLINNLKDRRPISLTDTS